jgi:hypothetical protein
MEEASVVKGRGDALAHGLVGEPASSNYQYIWYGLLAHNARPVAELTGPTDAECWASRIHLHITVVPLNTTPLQGIVR